ncbi:MAG: aldehyde ferredoxin oxidoreductase C-terminal domain-containing protein [Anaerolineae bacterium]
MGIDPAGMSSAEKVARLRAFRESEYEQLTDAVYELRGWTPDGVPTIAKLRELGIDFPDVIEVVRPHQNGS